MSTGHSSEYEEKTQSDSPLGEQETQRPQKSGKQVREEPINLRELHASPLAMQCFEHQSCYEFCQKVVEVQFHDEMACLFVLHLHGHQAILASVTFTLTPETISLVACIPNIGEPWHKKQHIGRQHYEPYIKPNFLRKLKRVFPFRYVKDEYAPLMRLIMKYFSCEGRFSRLYAYHIRLLMHFTRVWMMNIPYFICQNIERMTTFI